MQISNNYQNRPVGNFQALKKLKYSGFKCDGYNKIDILRKIVENKNEHPNFAKFLKEFDIKLSVKNCRPKYFSAKAKLEISAKNTMQKDAPTYKCTIINDAKNEPDCDVCTSYGMMSTAIMYIASDKFLNKFKNGSLAEKVDISYPNEY